MNKPINPPSQDAPLQPGDIVVPVERQLPKIRKVYSQVHGSTQFRVTDFVGKSAYGRKAVFVISRPGGEPICLWLGMVKRLPAKAHVSDTWKKASLAEYVP
jgi:hypothetical protein